MSTNNISWVIGANCRPGELTLDQLQYAIRLLPNPDDPNFRIESEYFVQLPKKLKIKFDEVLPAEVEMISYGFKLQSYAAKECPGERKKIWVFSGRILVGNFN